MGEQPETGTPTGAHPSNEAVVQQVLGTMGIPEHDDSAPRHAAETDPRSTLPPLDQSRMVDGTPAGFAGVDQAQDAPTIADFPIEEAPEEDLRGDVVDIIAQQLAPMIRQAIQRFAQGDRVRYAVSALPVPSPEQPDQMTMGMAIYVELPGAVLNTVIMNTVLIPHLHGWDQPSLDREIAGVLEAARQQRSGQLGAMQQAQQAAQAARNGQGGAGGTLFVPGR